MSVLDPFEVAEIEMWPFWNLQRVEADETLDRAEYTVYQKALRESKFCVVLNEKEITPADDIVLPKSVRVSVLPAELRESASIPIFDWRGERGQLPIWRGLSVSVA